MSKFHSLQTQIQLSIAKYGEHVRTLGQVLNKSWYHQVWGQEKSLSRIPHSVFKLAGHLCRFVESAIKLFLHLMWMERCRICSIEFQPRLRCCDQPVSVCGKCWRREIEIDPVNEWHYSSSSPDLLIVSAAHYSGQTRNLIHKLKYKNDPLVSIDLAKFVEAAYPNIRTRLPMGEVILVPVPLHKNRLRSRGFNQSELICQFFADPLGLKMYPRALSRQRNTQPQFGLSKFDRKANVSKAFKGNPRLLSGKTVILVDDICTSGSTLSECAQEAFACGAVYVAAITVAKA
jgi:ComF family protein